MQGGSLPGMGQSFGGRGNMNAPGVDIMMRVAQGLPPYVMEDSRGFALSCVVPNRLVGGLIGRGGSGTKEIQMFTGTKIGIRDIPGDSENRSMNIAGPLAIACVPHPSQPLRSMNHRLTFPTPPTPPNPILRIID